MPAPVEVYFESLQLRSVAARSPRRARVAQWRSVYRSETMSMFTEDVNAKLDMPLDAIIHGHEASSEEMDLTLNTAAAAETVGNRRVYVGNLSFQTSWQELKDHMRQAGEVVHATVLQGPDGRSKGCGLVEFATAEAAQNAISSLYDSQLNGRAIFVREDRERNGPLGGSRGFGGGAGGSSAPSGYHGYAGNGGNSGGGAVRGGTQARRVYVGNLPWGVAWQDLKDHMRQCGEVVHADVLTGPDGRSKGCGIVEYATEEEAKAAIAQLSDSVLKGRTIFVREDRESSSGPRGPPKQSMNMFNNNNNMMGGVVDSGLGSGFPPQQLVGNAGNRVFVGNLSWDVTWQDLKDSMRTVGNVLRADILIAPNGKSKGCGIVEFETPEEAQRAIQTMTDFVLKGRPIFVREDRESGAPPANSFNGGGVFDNAEGNGMDFNGGQVSDRAGRQLYVGNLSWGTNWQKLKDHFRSMGEVEYVEVATEPRGRSKGFGTVRFSTAEEAASAIATLNESELDGRQITVRLDSYA